MDILNSLRHANNRLEKQAYDTAEAPTGAGMLGGTVMPQTVSQLLDAQIKYHESKIADLKAAKEAISPDVERALNALAKL